MKNVHVMIFKSVITWFGVTYSECMQQPAYKNRWDKRETSANRAFAMICGVFTHAEMKDLKKSPVQIASYFQSVSEYHVLRAIEKDKILKYSLPFYKTVRDKVLNDVFTQITQLNGTENPN